MKYKIKCNQDKFAVVEVINEEMIITIGDDVKTFPIASLDLSDIDSLCSEKNQIYAYLKGFPLKFTVEKMSHISQGADSSDLIIDGKILSPVGGKLLTVHKKIGDVVKVGDILAELEAMKIIYKVVSNCDGKLEFILDAGVGFVKESDLIAKIEEK